MPTAIDVFIAYKFIKQLTKPWKNWEAYKLGLIDDRGKKLRSIETNADKDAYPLWKIMVRNLKRLLDKVPFGKSVIGSFAASLWLIKEELGVEDITVLENEFKKYLEESEFLVEHEELKEKINTVDKGRYKIKDEDDLVIFVRNPTEAVETVLGVPLFILTDSLTGNAFLVTEDEIEAF